MYFQQNDKAYNYIAIYIKDTLKYQKYTGIMTAIVKVDQVLIKFC
jgi:hypothetical protein